MLNVYVNIKIAILHLLLSIALKLLQRINDWTNQQREENREPTTLFFRDMLAARLAR
jgi:hypothetical protein